MPKLTNKPPTYLLHKPSGNARVRDQGKEDYLVRSGSRESREVYARLLVEFSRAEPALTPMANGFTISDLILQYGNLSQIYYLKVKAKREAEACTARGSLDSSKSVILGHIDCQPSTPSETTVSAIS